jgi:hypothetical protein
MKKVISISLATAALLLCGTLPVHAAGDFQGRARVQGHPEVGERGGLRGRPEFHEHRGVRERHEFDHHGFRRHHETRVFVAPGFGWFPGWWGPDYPPYAPPAYVPPQTEPQYFWYYCQNPPGYYPYIQQCPGGWQTVVPPPSG